MDDKLEGAGGGVVVIVLVIPIGKNNQIKCLEVDFFLKSHFVP